MTRQNRPLYDRTRKLPFPTDSPLTLVSNSKHLKQNPFKHPK